MDAKEYFIYLLSCYANTLAPKAEKNIEWKEIFSLAEKHAVTPVIAKEIKLIQREYRPAGNNLALFNLAYESANGSYYQKLEALSSMVSALSAAKIPHLIVKGAVLCNLYPEPELRTSSDTDVVLRSSDYFNAIDILRKKGFKVDFLSNNTASLYLKNEAFELTNELESINIQSKIYFSTPFDDISEQSGYTYKLRPVYHLLYVITHIAHHLKIGGSSVRMVMDIDVIIRNYPQINMPKFINLCENIRIKATALALLALSKKWFNTPLAIDFTFADRGAAYLYETLCAAVLEGCVLGSDSAHKVKKKQSLFEKIAAFFKNLFAKGKKKQSPRQDSFDCELSQAERSVFEELAIKPRRR
ncbi:MAG: nucleotidyltransferase family protein [Clostridiales bacterium]|nr:nucleotidyltransferase family protein [Clostridiales bacterium]